MTRRYPTKSEAAEQGYLDKTALRALRLKPTLRTSTIIYWQGQGFVTAYLRDECVKMRPYRAPTEAQLAALKEGRDLIGTMLCRRCGGREDYRLMERGLCYQCLEQAYEDRLAEEKVRVRAVAADWLTAGPIVFVDTETTGLEHYDQIIEIAILDETGAVLFHSLVRPSVPVSEGASFVHGITTEELSSAPTWPVVYPYVRWFVSGLFTICHNADFDRRMLRQTCKAYDLPYIEPSRWGCTMDLLTEANGGRFPNLSRAIEIAGAVSPDGEYHRALLDAECCRRIISVLAE